MGGLAPVADVDLARLLFEDRDELDADDAALFFRVGHASQLGEPLNSQNPLL